MLKMKVITKRHGKAPPWEDSRTLQRTINQIRKGKLVRAGVYRFKTFQEANQWMIKQMIATHELQNSKTS